MTNHGRVRDRCWQDHDIEVLISNVGPGQIWLNCGQLFRRLSPLCPCSGDSLGWPDAEVGTHTSASVAGRGLVSYASGFQPGLSRLQRAGLPNLHETGLMPQASTTRWAGLRFTEFLQYSVDEALKLSLIRKQTLATTRLRREIIQRLAALQRVGWVISI